MASQEFQAFQTAMASRPVPPPPASLDELRQRIDAAMGGLPLAEGTEAAEVDAGGVRAIEVRPVDLAADAPVLIYLHGGGFRIASALAYRAYGSHLAKRLGGRVLVVDYRLAPEHPYPAALDDTYAVFRWLIDSGTDAARIAVAGDSAGGGLAASLALRTLPDGPSPAAVVCCSPWVDMTVTSGTYDTNADSDKLFSRASADDASALYLGDHDRKDPLVSPVFGDWIGAPPMLIQVGSGEVLLDDSKQLAGVALSAGVDVTLRTYDDMPHVWQTNYPAFPEAVEAVHEMIDFVQRACA
jgi:epsilon-lactone hydrolase